MRVPPAQITSEAGRFHKIWIATRRLAQQMKSGWTNKCPSAFDSNVFHAVGYFSKKLLLFNSRHEGIHIRYARFHILADQEVQNNTDGHGDQLPGNGGHAFLHIWIASC